MTSFMMGQSAVAAQETHSATFRTAIPAQQQGAVVPQTGLGILMNGNVSGAPVATATSTTYSLSGMTPEQQKAVQDDLADRERQASALAAAGNLAETVAATSSGLMQQGLQAPPTLGGVPPPPTATTSSSSAPAMEGINWNLMDLGPALDDMEMDFAKLFDPAHEAENFADMNTPMDMVVTTKPSATGPTTNGQAAAPS